MNGDSKMKRLTFDELKTIEKALKIAYLILSEKPEHELQAYKIDKVVEKIQQLTF